MAKDHGSSVKDDKQYEGLREKGMSKSRAARIANDPQSSHKGGMAEPPCPSCGNGEWSTVSGGDPVHDPYPERAG